MLKFCTWGPKARDEAVMLAVPETDTLILFGGTQMEHTHGVVSMSV